MNTPKQTIPMKAVSNDRKTTIVDDFIPGHKYEVTVRAIGEDGQQQAMENSARNTIVMQGKLDNPSAPSELVATGYLNAVSLTWTNPTNYDFSHVEIWRLSINDMSTYAEFSSAFDQTEFNNGPIIDSVATKIAIASGTTYIDVVGESNVTQYYWVKAVNTSQETSDFHPDTTEGVSGTTLGVVATDVDDFSITATKMFNNTIILDGDSWTDNFMGGAVIAWNAHVIVYQGSSHSIMAGDTTNQYVYWDGSSRLYSTSATHPDLSGSGFMIAINKSGVHELVWNSSANMIIGNAYIANLNADKIDAGTLTGRTVQTAAANKRIVLSESDNTLRFHTDTVEDVIIIDDTIVGLRPGMIIEDATNGVMVRLKKGVNSTNSLYEDSISIRKDTSGSIFTGLKAINDPGVPIFNATHSAGVTGYAYSGNKDAGVNTYYVDESGNGYFAGNITIDGNVDGVDVAAHATRHQNTGDDEISVTDLSGLLADSQTPLAHTLDGTLHTGVGNIGNYVNIDGSNHTQFRTPAQVLADIDGVASAETFTQHKHIPAGSLGKNKTNPPTVESYGITGVLEFALNTDKADYIFHLPSDYASGDLSIHIHWTRNEAGLGGDDSGKTVKWQVKNLSINGTSENCNSGENTDAIQDVYDSATLGDNVVYHTTAITIAAAEIAIEDLIECEIMAVTVDSGTPLANPAFVCMDITYTAYRINR